MPAPRVAAAADTVAAPAAAALQRPDVPLRRAAGHKCRCLAAEATSTVPRITAVGRIRSTAMGGIPYYGYGRYPYYGYGRYPYYGYPYYGYGYGYPYYGYPGFSLGFSWGYGYPGYPAYAAPYAPYGYVVPGAAATYGGIRISGAPENAEVYLDGSYAGTVDDYNGTFERLDLEPGSHEIEIRGGPSPLKYDVNVNPGQTVTLHAKVK